MYSVCALESGFFCRMSAGSFANRFLTLPCRVSPASAELCRNRSFFWPAAESVQRVTVHPAALALAAHAWMLSRAAVVNLPPSQMKLSSLGTAVTGPVPCPM